MSIVLSSTTRPRVHLFDPTGQTWIADLENVRGVYWQPEVSKPGVATFEVPLADSSTASIVDRSIVKFSMLGAIQFGCVIDPATSPLAVDGRKWLRFENEPGLLWLLTDGIVHPEYGLKRKSPADRIFGFMSQDGPWRVTADWSAPLGYRWSAETVSVRVGFPPELRVPDPYWIGVAMPDVSQPPNKYGWMTADVTVGAAVDISTDVTADNYLWFYIDGEPMVTPDHAEAWGWKTVDTIPYSLAAGAHRIAAKIQNTDGIVAGAGPMGLVGNVYTLDTGGKRNGTLLQTDLTNWICTDVQPGWLRAQIIKKLHTESVAAGALGPSLLTLGFTDTHDSNGVAYTDPHGEQIIACDVNLCDAAMQMAESGIDIAVDAATMTLNVYVREGSNLSGTVELTLASAGSLKTYETTATTTRYSDVYARLADNTYVHRTDSAAVSALGGHVEVGLTVGTASDSATADNLADAQLAQAAHTVIEITAEASTLTGAQVYSDYNLGDTIKVPGHRGVGTIKARVMSLTIDATGDVVRAWPDKLEQDLSV